MIVNLKKKMENAVVAEKVEEEKDVLVEKLGEEKEGLLLQNAKEESEKEDSKDTEDTDESAPSSLLGGVKIIVGVEAPFETEVFTEKREEEAIGTKKEEEEEVEDEHVGDGESCVAAGNQADDEAQHDEEKQEEQEFERQPTRDFDTLFGDDSESEEENAADADEDDDVIMLISSGDEKEEESRVEEEEEQLSESSPFTDESDECSLEVHPEENREDLNEEDYMDEEEQFPFDDESSVEYSVEHTMMHEQYNADDDQSETTGSQEGGEVSVDYLIEVADEQSETPVFSIVGGGDAEEVEVIEKESSSDVVCDSPDEAGGSGLVAPSEVVSIHDMSSAPQEDVETPIPVGKVLANDELAVETDDTENSETSKAKAASTEMEVSSAKVEILVVKEVEKEEEVVDGSEKNVAEADAGGDIGINECKKEATFAATASTAEVSEIVEMDEEEVDSVTAAVQIDNEKLVATELPKGSESKPVVVSTTEDNETNVSTEDDCADMMEVVESMELKSVSGSETSNEVVVESNSDVVGVVKEVAVDVSSVAVVTPEGKTNVTTAKTDDGEDIAELTIAVKTFDEEEMDLIESAVAATVKETKEKEIQNEECLLENSSEMEENFDVEVNDVMLEEKTVDDVVVEQADIKDIDDSNFTTVVEDDDVVQEKHVNIIVEDDALEEDDIKVDDVVIEQKESKDVDVVLEQEGSKDVDVVLQQDIKVDNVVLKEEEEVFKHDDVVCKLDDVKDVDVFLKQEAIKVVDVVSEQEKIKVVDVVSEQEKIKDDVEEVK